MSFVSLVATESYITVVSDGRVTRGTEVIQEDYQKFKIINNNIIVGYAGQKEPCEKFIQESGLLNLDVIDSGYLFKHLHDLLMMHDYKDSNIKLGIGGLNNNNQIELLTLDSLSPEPKIINYIPMNGNINFAFLYKPMNEAVDVGVNNKFVELMRKYGFDTAEKMITVQILLNNFVAKDDFTVNENTFSHKIIKDLD